MYLGIVCSGNPDNMIPDFIPALGSLWQKTMLENIHGYVTYYTVQHSDSKSLQDLFF